MERAGSVTAVRTGATCFVGSGDGIGARLAGAAAPCVERAGVEVLERETLVRRRVDRGVLAFGFDPDLDLGRAVALERFAGFEALATGRRDVRRALPLTLRCAAFNCFPLP
jgi:hypothetical protein